MASVSFGTATKRRNSTMQPTMSDTRTVTLKERTSQDAPTFIVTGNDFDYNYCTWNGKYYFITDIESLHNNMIAVHCVMDPLATYKDYILSSTQYVAYSSVSGGTWLSDQRLPVLKSTVTSTSSTSLASLFNSTGFYVLTAVGQDGCNTFAADIGNLHSLLDKINDWGDDIIDDILGETYDFSTTETALESLGQMMTRTGVVGNAYESAPSCIRSCIWVPFFATPFVNTGKELYLGQFDTELSLYTLNAYPVTGSISVSIPWYYSDWRRGYCEDVYLYLPLVGMVALSSDNLTQNSSITIKYSATATDGCVSYQVISGSQIIGAYGGQCSANYPIGISQQASSGEIMQTAFEGLHKTVNAGFSAASQINPISIAGGGIDTAMTGIESAYNTMDVAMSRNNTCIGGVGGGAGAGLDLSVTCYVVTHPTIIEPSAMQATMGLPTMQPLTLSSCSGYCQCVNAHVAAPATAQELNAIDSMLNSGFYIE